MKEITTADDMNVDLNDDDDKYKGYENLDNKVR
jgi:hypothetical protein